MDINNTMLKYWKSDAQKYISPFTKLQINEIEKLISKKLPNDLIQFLTKFAGVDLGIGTIDDPIAFFVVKVSNGTKFFAGMKQMNIHLELAIFQHSKTWLKYIKL